MSAIYKILAGVLTNALATFFKWIRDFAETYFKFSKKKTAYQKQADLVQSIADEIKKLVLEKHEVPKELTDRLRSESVKLIDGTFTVGI